MFVYPIAAAPVLLAYVAQYAFDSYMAFYIVLSLVGLIGAAVYWVAMDSSVGVAERDTERILTALAKGEGPVQS